MKKYIKPTMEELNLGATTPLMSSFIYVDQDGTVIDPTGGDGGSGMWAPGRKGRVYIEDDDEEENFGW